MDKPLSIVSYTRSKSDTVRKEKVDSMVPIYQRFGLVILMILPFLNLIVELTHPVTINIGIVAVDTELGTHMLIITYIPSERDSDLKQRPQHTTYQQYGNQLSEH